MPLRAFEAGQQKGGNYFCSACGIHSEMAYFIDHALHCQFLSLDERQKAILKGTVAKRSIKKCPKWPFDALSKSKLEEELASRAIYDGKTKKEMKHLLSENLQGKQRVPALLINTLYASLSEYGLESYEILPCEPLHDIGNHIENFLTEFPKHFSVDECKVLEDALTLSLSGKESKRCVDYRICLIKTTGIAHQAGIMSHDALLALNTLVEMQRILYSSLLP